MAEIDAAEQEKILVAIERFRAALKGKGRDYFAIGDGGVRGTPKEKAAIRELQIALGLPVENQTGYFGTITRDALEKFQQASISDDSSTDLAIDSKAGMKTAGRLFGAPETMIASSPESIKSPASISKVVSKGAKLKDESLLPNAEWGKRQAQKTPEELLATSVTETDLGGKKKLVVDDPGKALVMRLEGFGEKRYGDIKHNPTIGYGISLGKGTPFKGLINKLTDKEGKITPETAYMLLQDTMDVEKMQVASEKFGEGVIDKLRPHERDGVMSVVYSLPKSEIGGGLIDRVNKLAKIEEDGPKRVAAVEALVAKINEYNNGGNKGMKARREIEGLVVSGDFIKVDEIMDAKSKGVPLLDGSRHRRGATVEGIEVRSFQEYYRKETSSVEVEKQQDKLTQNSVNPVNLERQNGGAVRTV